MCWDEWCACLTFTTWHTCNVTTVHWITKIAEIPGIALRVLCVEMSGALVYYSQHDIHVMLQLCTQIQKMVNYLVIESSVWGDEWRARVTIWHTCNVTTVCVLQLEFCVVRWVARMFNVYNITYMFCYNSTLNYRNCWTTWYCTEHFVCWEKWCACVTFTTWHTCNVTTVQWITKNAELPGFTVRVLCCEMSCGHV